MNIGDKVKIKAPFNVHFPNEYEVIGISEVPDSYIINVHGETGSDFHIDLIEAV